MRIVHVNFSDKYGGAAIALKRFHNFLLKKGIDSKIVVSERNDIDQNILSINRTSEKIKNLVKSTLSRQLKYIFKSNNKNTHSINMISSKNIDLINSLKPDFVNLHWLGNETISISDISKIKCKVIWTLHDMWPFCGAEHYANDLRYIEGYTNKNRPKNETGFDINKFVWNKKIKHYKKIDKIICTSKWMLDCAKKSYLFKNKSISQIPLLLDHDLWKPYEKEFARNFFNLKTKNKIILYGADNFLKNKRKGFEIFKKSINEVHKKFDEKFEVILFGTHEIDNSLIQNQFKNIKITNFGKISDDSTLRLIYSCSDLVVIPSLNEAFGLVALEAVHCGIPCVVFEDTGLTSIIDHHKDGYVSKYNSIEDLKNGIIWCLKNLNNKDKIFNNAINKFDNDQILKKYLNFIQE